VKREQTTNAKLYNTTNFKITTLHIIQYKIAIFSICRKEEELWQILEFEGEKIWREKALAKRLWNLDLVIYVQK
jgi:hypothetical protein